MNLTESFLTALDSLLANKMRAVLTMLGVIIGVASVIALLSIGNGVTASVTDEIQSIGTNLITIATDQEVSDGYPTLSLSDIDALADPINVPDVSQVAASVQGTEDAVYEGRSSSATVLGVTANYFSVNNLTELEDGNLLTDADNESRARVVVLGATTANELFNNDYPIGKNIKIGGTTYEIIGVMSEQDSSALSNTNERVYMPLSTAHSRLYPTRTRHGELAVNQIAIQAASEDVVDAAMTQITDTLIEQHNIAYATEPDFTLFSQNDLLDSFSTITSTLTLFLGAIASISLFVGGIGIMNIMLVSVTERTREIGIRKAVGALKRDILIQFLIESLMLSLLGGLLGILLGWGVTEIASTMLDFAPVINSSTVLLATSFAAGVGVIFGIYPAWRASGLRPIDALRYE